VKKKGGGGGGEGGGGPPPGGGGGGGPARHNPRPRAGRVAPHWAGAGAADTLGRTHAPGGEGAAGAGARGARGGARPGARSTLV